MKDRRGFEYEALLTIQASDLAVWEKKIHAVFYQPIADYVKKSNRCATQPEEVHQVFRGQDLIEIIRQWPDVQPPYPSVSTSTEDVL